MTDRKLLELAAKAAGIAVIRSRLDDSLARDMLVANGHRNPHHETGPWNPLTDDGDAFRLMVKLGMIVSIINHPKLLQVEATAYPPDHRPEGRMALEPLGADPLAATRRAIVRAAAEIGRSMK